MLPSTDEEIAVIRDYVEGQAPDLTVTFCQKVYSESVLSHRHDVWDVHTDKDRWWVITNPTNLYSQEQFPNLDYAVTFHMGLMLRVPRTERPSIKSAPVEPFAKCFEAVAGLHDALGQAHEVADLQTVGVRCREALLLVTGMAQVVLPWNESDDEPKGSDFKAWIGHVCTTVLPGATHKHRRQLLRTQAEAAWTFVNWLTHSSSSTWHDAEAAVAATENTVALSTNAITLFIRGVPDACPECGSLVLAPLRADVGDELWERPACPECEWMGTPVRISATPTPFITREGASSDGACVIPSSPLRSLKRPGSD